MHRAILLVGLGTAAAGAAALALLPPQSRLALAETPRSSLQAAEQRIAPLGARQAVPALIPVVEHSPAPSSHPPPVRNVTPEGITAGPKVTGPLKRVEAPPPPQPALPAPERQERLFNPIVAAAGTLKLRDREIRLAGIVAPDFAERCGEGPQAWPCGRMARAALRRFIQGRAIECAVPAGADAVPDPASCSVAGTNLSEWLVAQGWAKRAGDLYADLEAEARAAERGLWAPRRPDDGMLRQPAAVLARSPPSAPDSAAPMRARLSDSP